MITLSSVLQMVKKRDIGRCIGFGKLRYVTFERILLQSTPLNRVTLVPEHFDPIKRSELILFLWFCSWPSDPIKRCRLYLIIIFQSTISNNSRLLYCGLLDNRAT